MQSIAIDRTKVITGSEDFTVREWNLETGEPDGLFVRAGNAQVRDFAISPDSSLIVAATDNGLRGRALRNGSPEDFSGFDSSQYRAPTSRVTFTPDARWLFAWRDPSPLSNAPVLLWRKSGFSLPPIILMDDSPLLRTVAVSANSHWLLTGGMGTKTCLWDISGVHERPKCYRPAGDDGDVQAAAFSADSRWLAMASGRAVRAWRLTVNGIQGSPVVFPTTRSPNQLQISADGRWLTASFSDPSEGNSLQFWALTSGQAALPHFVARFHYWLKRYEISPDGRWLMAAPENGRFQLFDLTTKTPNERQQVFDTGTEMTDIAYSPDGKMLAIGTAIGSVLMWDLAAKPIPHLQILRGHTGYVSNVAFAHDGQQLASASSDGSVRLWNVDLRQLGSVVLRGHTGPVKSARFTPDGKFVVTSDSGGNVRLWPRHIKDLIERAALTVGRNFTGEEWQEYFPGLPYRKTFPQFPGDEPRWWSPSPR